MPLVRPLKNDLKGAPTGGTDLEVVAGYPTEGPRKFDTDLQAEDSPVMVRKLGEDDRSRIKAFSRENDGTHWLKKKLFKKEVDWPRDLYVNIVGCKALMPPAAIDSKKATLNGVDAETATASVTTDGDGDGEGATTTERSTGPGAANPAGGSEAEPPTLGDYLGVDGAAGMRESSSQISVAESSWRANGGESCTSSDAEDDEEYFSDDSSEAEVDSMAGLECFVRVRNATTGSNLQTQSIRGGANPLFMEAFVVPCQGPRDGMVLGVYAVAGEQAGLIGEAALPLDARVVGASHTVVLSVKDARGRNRGFLRVEAFWVDEAKPRKERGEFYYRVVHPNGVSLREEPSLEAGKSLHVMEQGEVFLASERQWHVGDPESLVFVKVWTSRDRWARSGWCFEALCADAEGGEGGEAVLERASPPRREAGKFFYRVCHPAGARLHSKADVTSQLHGEVIPQGQVLEVIEKWTPAGSPVTYGKVDNRRGYVVHNRNGRGLILAGSAEPALEAIDCPEGITVSSAGLDVVPSAHTPPRARSRSRAGTGTEHPGSLSPTSAKARNERAATLILAAEAKAAAAAARRLYRVREHSGMAAIRTPDIDAPQEDFIEAGIAFFGNAEVVKHYEGIGDVAFVRRDTDGLWVRANKPGIAVMLDCFTNRVEPGAFTYRVAHENGVLVRTAPGLDAPPVKPRRILPVTKLINVCERLTRAEDMMSLSRPPIFLRLAGNDGWVFDRRGRTLVCEDVTVKSRIATASVITAEAVRLAQTDMAK